MKRPIMREAVQGRSYQNHVERLDQEYAITPLRYRQLPRIEEPSAVDAETSEINPLVGESA